MAYDGWLEFNGVELANVARTATLAPLLGIDTVWTTPEGVQWIPNTLGDSNYFDIEAAPWYDAGYPASGEFAGIMPLGVPGLDDSTLEAVTTEYTTDGGHSGKSRNATLSLVASVAIIASTHRGAEYGKRWLDRVLRGGSDSRTFCAGADLRYFRYAEEDAPIVHRRDVRTTRGTSVTRKRSSDCSVTWLVTFTMTAGDPYEYGEPVPRLSELGGVVTGPGVISSGATTLVEESCPVYDYTPVYDPLYPALVAPPTAPDFYPEGWGIVEGMTFDRFWARIEPVEPSPLLMVPVVTLTTTLEARMVRFSVWPADADSSTQCDPLFSVIATYVPPGLDFVIDGEQRASYVWDGFSPVVRRTDSLVFGPDAEPVQWAAFNDNEDLLVTLDIFFDSDGLEGGGEVRAALDLVAKSD